MDFMPYEGAPREGRDSSGRLFLALGIGAGLVAGAWVLGAFSGSPWSEATRASSATSARTISDNGAFATPDANGLVAAHR